jgi:Fe-S-cluster formation regulator IscX/YfhJ
MTMRHAIFPLLVLLTALSYAQSGAADLAVAPYEDRPAVYNALLTERLDTLLPKLMRETQIDMWVVIAREYNDDPIFLSLVPKPRFTA